MEKQGVMEEEREGKKEGAWGERERESERRQWQPLCVCVC